MKHRFETDTGNRSIRNLILSAALFVLIIFISYQAFASVSHQTSEEELQALESALNRSIMHCYAIEGQYPESLDYIKENYGLTYNESLFTVHYQPLGANLMPDVTITVKEEDAS